MLRSVIFELSKLSDFLFNDFYRMRASIGSKLTMESGNYRTNPESGYVVSLGMN